MKAVGVSDFVLKARGKLATVVRVTNAEISILKFKKLFFFFVLVAVLWGFWSR